MSEHPAANASPSHRISPRTLAALLAAALIPLAVIVYSAHDAESARKAWRTSCLAPGKELVEVSGLVRQRDGGFYLEVGEASHYLGKACDGKYARACLDSNPGKGLLASHPDQPASARLCDGEVLSYQVAGSAFYK